ncbi:hypothetical protein JCM10213_000563 [Rhodosporidiobolus nylandii]
MANPRQRRKMRSGTGKVKTSKQSVKNKHKVIVKGPKELADAWDKKKTVRQNYAALGLLVTSNPRQQGGLVPKAHTPYAVSSATPATVEDLEAALDAQLSSDSEDEGDEPVASTSAAGAAKEEKLKPGMARIVRDENGNVVSIIMGTETGAEVEEKLKAPVRGGEDSEDEEGSEDEEVEEEQEEKTPWGAPMKDWSVQKAEEAPAFDDDEDLEMLEDEPQPLRTKQGIPVGGGVKKVAAKSDVVRNLEQRVESTGPTKVIRHSSALEKDWLVSLIAKYGNDLGKMARDRKANVWQRTQGELKRMIAKAGGVDKLRALAAAQAQE